jgi:hypothetical protein
MRAVSRVGKHRPQGSRCRCRAMCSWRSWSTCGSSPAGSAAFPPTVAALERLGLRLHKIPPAIFIEHVSRAVGILAARLSLNDRVLGLCLGSTRARPIRFVYGWIVKRHLVRIWDRETRHADAVLIGIVRERAIETRVDDVPPCWLLLLSLQRHMRLRGRCESVLVRLLACSAILYVTGLGHDGG